MPDIVVTEFMDEEAVDRLRSSYEVLYDTGLASDPDRLLEILTDARALVVRNRTKVDAGVLAAAPRLRIVARLGVGLDNIDVAECRRRDIVVAPATGANAIAVAEYVIGSLLVLLRGVFDMTARVAAGEWPRTEGVGREISGRSLGLIGLGLISREVAIRARALGMKVTAHDPFVPEDDEAWTLAGRLDFDELLAGSDAVSVHVPLSEDTRHLLDVARIRLMPRGALLINTSRGGIVDEDAVVEALRSGHLGGAALDVFEEEPLGSDGGRRLAGIPNLLLTPHVAGITVESEIRTGRMTVESVTRALGPGT